VENLASLIRLVMLILSMEKLGLVLINLTNNRGKAERNP
jgi:hypothetical protein